MQDFGKTIHFPFTLYSFIWVDSTIIEAECKLRIIAGKKSISFIDDLFRLIEWRS